MGSPLNLPTRARAKPTEGDAIAFAAVLRHRVVALPLLLVATLTSACGGDEPSPRAEKPLFGGTRDGSAPTSPGFPELATKNTTRVSAGDSAGIAAGVALAVHPSGTPDTRPAAVTLVDIDNWAVAISAAQLAGPGVGAPILFTDGESLHEASRGALARLRPTGIESLRGAQAIRAGTPARAPGLSEVNVEGATPAALAREIDRLHTRVTGRAGESVVVAPLSEPATAMPAAAWAAKSGDPVLWADSDELPRETVSAISSRNRPRVHVLGSRAAIGPRVMRRLERLGDVERIAGADAAATSVAFARHRRAGFGWGVVDPGHGLVFASSARPTDAAAAAPLSAAGSYGPLLVLPDGAMPAPIGEYLLDIRPGYESDPVRGVYNHGWLMGDVTTISSQAQSRIDSLLEIQPVDREP